MKSMKQNNEFDSHVVTNKKQSIHSKKPSINLPPRDVLESQRKLQKRYYENEDSLNSAKHIAPDV